MSAVPQQPHCAICDSTDVRADAYAAFNRDTGDWELSTTFDKGAVCEDCGGDTSLVWKLIEDQEVETSPPPRPPMWVVFYTLNDDENQLAEDYWQICDSGEIAQTTYEDAAAMGEFHAGGFGPIRGASEPHYLDGGKMNASTAEKEGGV